MQGEREGSCRPASGERKGAGAAPGELPRRTTGRRPGRAAGLGAPPPPFESRGDGRVGATADRTGMAASGFFPLLGGEGASGSFSPGTGGLEGACCRRIRPP
jgi:hypothetical protein